MLHSTCFPQISTALITLVWLYLMCHWRIRFSPQANNYTRSIYIKDNICRLRKGIGHTGSCLHTPHLLTCVQISLTKNKNTFVAQWTSDKEKSRAQTTRRDVSLNGKENKHATIYSGPLPAAQTRRMSTHASISTHLRIRHCLQHWKDR